MLEDFFLGRYFSPSRGKLSLTLKLSKQQNRVFYKTATNIFILSDKKKNGQLRCYTASFEQQLYIFS